MYKGNKGEIKLWVAITIIVSALVIFLGVCLIVKNISDNKNHNINISGDTDINGSHSDNEINDTVFEKPTIIGEYTYTGRPQTVGLNGYNSKVMKQTNATRKEAGTQEVIIELKDTSKYSWKDGTTDAIKLEWAIQKAPITIEWMNLEIRYDGDKHSPNAIATGLSTDKLTVKVSGASSEEGEHIATAELEGTAAENYEITNPTATYNITKKSGDIGSSALGDVKLNSDTFIYQGYEIEPVVTIRDGNTLLTEGTDYTVRYENNINVGTAKVIVVGKGKKYTGRVVKEFTITRNCSADVYVEDKIYNGVVQNGVTGKNVDIEGTENAKNVGTYKIVVTPKTGYAWTDGTYDAKEYTWKINEGIKVGDYVSYTPIGKSSAQVSTETKGWRILSISEDEVLITTYGAVNQNEVMLTGNDSYVNIETQLNKICEDAYSNKDKGLKARSMTIEDLNKACQYTVPKTTLRYAYYLTAATGTITQNGNVYTKIKHSNSLYGISEPRFYSYELNGILKTVESPKRLTADEGILLSQTYYTYNPSSSSSVANPIAGELLGSGNGWLASRCVKLENNVANFCAYYASSSEVLSNYLCNSSGYSYSPVCGLRPVVSISPSKIDVENANTDGSVANPWGIK